MTAGAVYNPVPSMVPIPAGFVAQVMPVLLVFVTVAANCCVSPGRRVAPCGDTATATVGTRDTVEEDDCLLSEKLMAVIVTFCPAGIGDGAT